MLGPGRVIPFAWAQQIRLDLMRVDRVNQFAVNADKRGLRLTAEAQALVAKIEHTAEAHNFWMDRSITLAVCLREIPDLRRCLMRHGLDPSRAADVLESEVFSRSGEDSYNDDDQDDYVEGRFGNRSALATAAIVRVRSSGLEEITPTQLVGALLDNHDGDFPVLQNAQWTDEGLHVPFNTLSHILGEKRQELWLSFETLRKELGLATPEAMRREPIDAAPSHVKDGLLSFFADHPDYSKNCFLIMPFRDVRPLTEAQLAIRTLLAAQGLKVLRADDFVYSENVFTNIEVYMYGCRFAVSVLERSLSDQHNANVALEIGYMLGMKKDVCLLKERTVTTLPSDLQGRLYSEFDMFSVVPSIEASLGRWLRDRRILGSLRERP